MAITVRAAATIVAVGALAAGPAWVPSAHAARYLRGARAFSPCPPCPGTRQARALERPKALLRQLLLHAASGYTCKGHCQRCICGTSTQLQPSEVQNLYADSAAARSLLPLLADGKTSHQMHDTFRELHQLIRCNADEQAADAVLELAK